MTVFGGDIIVVSDLNDLLSAWTPYTPVWTASTTGPTLGNGTLTGAYKAMGKTIHVRIPLTIGSTTVVATGNWRFTLPAAPQVNGVIGAYADDSSASRRWSGQARFIAAATTGDNMRIIVSDNTASVTESTPFVWATGDVLLLSGTYEAT